MIDYSIDGLGTVFVSSEEENSPHSDFMPLSHSQLPLLSTIMILHLNDKLSGTNKTEKEVYNRKK